MAAPETNLAASRVPADVNGNHVPPPPSNRHLQNFNTFQFVSQLVSATPPYLFNMSAPFPGNFFSDLLRRMAPRAGTPGLPLDTNLQQHIRAALLAKGAPPPTLPQSVMPPPLDLAAMAAQHRQQTMPPAPSQEKGVKRSLFSDVSALSSCEEENGIKRQRIEESREDRREYPPEGLTAPFLMQPPFLPSAVPPPPDVMTPWATRASLMRPQMPISAHVPANPLDPYRLLLDLRLAGQLRSMAASQALHHKDMPLAHPPMVPPISSINRTSPPREPRPQKDNPVTPSSQHQHPTVLRGDDSRISAFHPPGRASDAPPDTSDEEGGERRSNSRNSCNSSASSSNRDNLGTQYIFKHLTEIYRTIDIQRNDKEDREIDEREGGRYFPIGAVVRPSSELTRPLASEAKHNSPYGGQLIEGDKSNNNGGDCRNKPVLGHDELNLSRDYFPASNGHLEGRRSPPMEVSNLESNCEKDARHRD